MTNENASNELDALPSMSRPRDLSWDHWAKFTNIGDSISGYIRDVFYRPEEIVGTSTMKPQRGLTLEQADGTLINVGIKCFPFVLAGTDNLRLGDPVKIVFAKENPPQQKMYSPTKIFQFFGKNLDSTVGNKTVKQLTDEDAAAGGTVVATPSSVEDDIQLDTKDEMPPMEGMPASA